MNTAKKWKDGLFSLISTLIYLPVVLLFSRRTKTPPKVAGKNCLIIGNGPSLSADLEKARSYSYGLDKVCVNFFGDSPLFHELKPQVYVFYDPIFWKNGSGEVYARRDRLFKILEEQTTWDLCIYAPFAFKTSEFYLSTNNDHIRFIFFNARSIDGFPGFIRFCLNYRLGMPRASNVIIPSLVYAITSGYKKIYLTGADHSWHQDLEVKSDSKVYITHRHFSGLSVPMPVYLMPDDEESATMHQLFLTWAHLFRGYELINDWARRKKVEIINLTVTSFIDAFKKQ